MLGGLLLRGYPHLNASVWPCFGRLESVRDGAFAWGHALKRVCGDVFVMVTVDRTLLLFESP